MQHKPFNKIYSRSRFVDSEKPVQVHGAYMNFGYWSLLLQAMHTVHVTCMNMILGGHDAVDKEDTEREACAEGVTFARPLAHRVREALRPQLKTFDGIEAWTVLMTWRTEMIQCGNFRCSTCAAFMHLRRVRSSPPWQL